MSICPPDMLLKIVLPVVCNRVDIYMLNLGGAKINENKNSMKTKIQFHFFIHLQSK